VGLPRIGITSSTVATEGPRVDAAHRGHVDGVVAAGGLPVVLPQLGPDLVEPTLECIDGLLVPGTGEGALQDDFARALVRAAVAAGLPVLGVGSGHHVVNLALGGALDPDVAAGPAVEAAHQVRLAPGALLAAVVGTTSLEIACVRSGVVRQAGAGLQVVARSGDGRVVGVEGVGDLRVLGVQWCPEVALEHPAHAAVFEWLVREAAVHPDAEVVDLVRADEVGPVPPARSVQLTFS